MPAGNMTNITAILSQSELDIVNVKVIDNLTHGTLGILRSATPDNPATVAGGGTANFKVQKLVQWDDYTAANRNDAGDVVKQELKVKIDIKKAHKAHYEVETLDLDGLDFQSRGAYISYIQAGISKTLTALLDAYYIRACVQAAAQDEANREVVNAKFLLETPMTKQEREDAYFQISDAKIDVARQITKYDLGSNEANYAVFLFKKLTNRLLFEMPKGGDSATTIGKELSGVDGIQVVAGLGAVKDHLFFGKNMPKGSSYSKTEDFDFSKVAGVIAHGEAVFIATQAMHTTAATDPDSGNQKYISKFNIFEGAVRPELIRVLRTAHTTVAAAK